MIEWASQVSDYLAGLGLDSVKDHYKEKLDEVKLKRQIMDYITSQKDFQEICSLSEEFDFAGLPPGSGRRRPPAQEYVPSDSLSRSFSP